MAIFIRTNAFSGKPIKYVSVCVCTLMFQGFQASHSFAQNDEGFSNGSQLVAITDNTDLEETQEVLIEGENSWPDESNVDLLGLDSNLTFNAEGVLSSVVLKPDPLPEVKNNTQILSDDSFEVGRVSEDDIPELYPEVQKELQQTQQQVSFDEDSKYLDVEIETNRNSATINAVDDFPSVAQEYVGVVDGSISDRQELNNLGQEEMLQDSVLVTDAQNEIVIDEVEVEASRGSQIVFDTVVSENVSPEKVINQLEKNLSLSSVLIGRDSPDVAEVSDFESQIHIQNKQVNQEAFLIQDD